MYSRCTMVRCSGHGFLRHRFIGVSSSLLVIVLVNAVIAPVFLYIAGCRSGHCRRYGRDRQRPECAGAASEVQAAGGSSGTLSCFSASPSCCLSPDGYCVAALSAVPSTTGMCSYHYYYYYFYLKIVLASSVLSPEKRVIAACQPNNKLSSPRPFCLQRGG